MLNDPVFCNSVGVLVGVTVFVVIVMIFYLLKVSHAVHSLRQIRHPYYQYHTHTKYDELINKVGFKSSRLVESTHHKKIAVIYFITAIYIALSGRGLSSIIRIEIMGGRVLGDGHV